MKPWFSRNIRFVAVLFAIAIVVAVVLVGPRVWATSSDETQLAALCVSQAGSGAQMNALAIDTTDTYALVNCIAGEAGGQIIAIKNAGTWQVKLGGGGAFSASDLIANGVPPATASYLVANLKSTSGCHPVRCQGATSPPSPQ